MGREGCKCSWLRGQDLNLRPSGYEPDELPGCSTPRCGVGWRRWGRREGVEEDCGVWSFAEEDGMRRALRRAGSPASGGLARAGVGPVRRWSLRAVLSFAGLATTYSPRS